MMNGQGNNGTDNELMASAFRLELDTNQKVVE